MRFPVCIAVSFALILAVVSPLAAQAESQSRSLTPEEGAFIRAFNQLMGDNPNLLVQRIPDRVKADDAQLICTKLDEGYSVASVNESLGRMSRKVSDPTIREALIEYTSTLLVVATYKLCPQHHEAVAEYTNTPD
jgi:hypothetical protein